MYSLFVFVSLSVFLCMVVSEENVLQCSGLHEKKNCIRDCPPEKTCKNKDIKISCLNSNKTCQLKCVCEDNYYRNEAGQCVSKEFCDKCPGANEYFSCGSACDNVCADLHIQNQTNCRIKNIKCNEMCYCTDGHARNTDKICVPYHQCQPRYPRLAHAQAHAHSESDSQCSQNEEYQSCKRTCPPDTCVSLVAKFKCQSDPPCVPGCVCKSGYLRNGSSAPCLPIRQCPQLANSPD